VFRAADINKKQMKKNKLSVVAKELLSGSIAWKRNSGYDKDP
jgi:hypothetical protein